MGFTDKLVTTSKVMRNLQGLLIADTYFKLSVTTTVTRTFSYERINVLLNNLYSDYIQGKYCQRLLQGWNQYQVAYYPLSSVALALFNKNVAEP